jgi:hypothetical protein
MIGALFLSWVRDVLLDYIVFLSFLLGPLSLYPQLWFPG